MPVNEVVFRNRPYQIFLLVTAMMLTIMSCSDSGESNGRANTAEPLPFSGKKVTFMVALSHAVGGKALANWFHEETGAIVELKVVHYSKLGASILADNAAPSPQTDVYMNWYVDLGKLVDNHALTDLTDFIENNAAIIQPDDFLPSLYDAHTKYRERRWALPFDGDIHVLFYRKSILARYALPPPDTWEDYLHVARTITQNEGKNGVYGSAIMAHPTPILVISCFMNRLGSYGGQLLDSNGRPTIDSVEAQKALQDMVDQSEYALPTPTKTDFFAARDAFLTGQVAMVEFWTDIGIMAEDPNQSLIKGDWGVVQMPRGTGAKAQHAPALNAGFVLGLSSRAPHPEVGKAFMLFATRQDILLRLNVMNSGVDPCRLSILESKEFNAISPELRQAGLGALHAATPWPIVPEMMHLLRILSENIAAAIDKRKTTQQALGDTQREWLKILP